MRLPSDKELACGGTIVHGRSVAVEGIGGYIFVSPGYIEDGVWRENLVSQIDAVNGTSGPVLRGCMQRLLDSVKVRPREILSISVNIPFGWLDDNGLPFDFLS